MSSGLSDGVYQSITPEIGPQRPPWAVPLSKEALFRIQLSLASRRSSVMVLETVCRIFTGTLQQRETPVKVQVSLGGILLCIEKLPPMYFLIPKGWSVTQVTPPIYALLSFERSLSIYLHGVMLWTLYCLL